MKIGSKVKEKIPDTNRLIDGAMMFTSNEYKYEYGPFLYNAAWNLDNFIFQDGGWMVENEIKILPFLYDVAAIPGHLLTQRNLATLPVQCSCHSWTKQNLTNSFGSVIARIHCVDLLLTSHVALKSIFFV